MDDPDVGCVFSHNQWLVPKFSGAIRHVGKDNSTEVIKRRKIEVNTSEQLRQAELRGEELLRRHADALKATSSPGMLRQPNNAPKMDASLIPDQPTRGVAQDVVATEKGVCYMSVLRLCIYLLDKIFIRISCCGWPVVSVVSPWRCSVLAFAFD